MLSGIYYITDILLGINSMPRPLAQGDALNSGLLQYINPLSENEKKTARVNVLLPVLMLTLTLRCGLKLACLLYIKNKPASKKTPT